MSLESQIRQLQAKHKALDDAFHGFHKIVQGTQDVVSLMFREQREYHGKTDYRLDSLERLINECSSHQDKHFDKIEETLIQVVNHLTR